MEVTRAAALHAFKSRLATMLNNHSPVAPLTDSSLASSPPAASPPAVGEAVGAIVSVFLQGTALTGAEPGSGETRSTIVSFEPGSLRP